MKIIKHLFFGLLGIFGILLILYISLYFFHSGEYNVAKTVEQDKTIPHVTVDGVTFHAQTFGIDTNQVVIILHGGPGNDFRYLLELKALSDKYFVVFYDQRGTGLSPRVPPGELTKDNMIEDLYRIVKNYGKGRKVNIIGHSWGGMLATAYAGKYPETINRLVLAEPGPLTPEMAEEFGTKFQPDVDWEFLKHGIRSYFQSLHVEEIDDQARTDYFYRAFVSNTELENNPIAAYFCNNDMSNAKINYWRYSWTTYTELLMKNMQGDFSAMTFGKEAKNFKGRILILVGNCNKLIGETFQKKQISIFNDAEIMVIEDAGHFMFEEKPSECISAINRFFEDSEMD